MMKTLKDIFVPYDIAVQLKEIGFDERCIAYFNNTSVEPDHPYLYMYSDYNRNSTEVGCCMTVPTWEQVFKWFRDRKIYDYVPEGDIKGFPIEIVKKMVEYQVSQGFEEDVSMFEKRRSVSTVSKGFD